MWDKICSQRVQHYTVVTSPVTKHAVCKGRVTLGMGQGVCTSAPAAMAEGCRREEMLGCLADDTTLCVLLGVSVTVA